MCIMKKVIESFINSKSNIVIDTSKLDEIKKMVNSLLKKYNTSTGSVYCFEDSISFEVVVPGHDDYSKIHFIYSPKIGKLTLYYETSSNEYFDSKEIKGYIKHLNLAREILKDLEGSIVIGIDKLF